eukprot:7445438-Pyramimonas_sp.AAC.1
MCIDDPTSIPRLLAQSNDIQPVGEHIGAPELHDIETAAEELDHLQKRLWKEKRRRYNPPWAWPIELTIMLLAPQYLTRPGVQRAGMGHDTADYQCADPLAER